MATPKVVVAGGNFAGLTGALELKQKLGAAVDVHVISKSDRFTFTPSQIWVPFGWRKPEDISFPLEPVLDSHGIHFSKQTIRGFDLETKSVLTDAGPEAYDYLLVATGPEQNYDVVPGLGPKQNSLNIVTMDEAVGAGEAFQRLLREPGPVVIGATQGAACFGAAYEFLFNFAHALRKNGMAKRVPITFVTAEPFLGHFGIGGLKHGEAMLKMFLKRLKVDFRTSTAIEEVMPNEVRLEGGEVLPSSYTMLIPPFKGVSAVADSPGLGDAKGFIPTKPTYEHVSIPDVFAAGVAVQVQVPWQTPVAIGVPKTGFPAEVMAKVAAHNIASKIRGEEPHEEKEFGKIPAICVMDAGNMGVMILSDSMLPPHKHEALIPGPQAHWAKLAFEKYFLWKMRHGYVNMP